MAGKKTITQDVAPSAARLTESLRDIGYDFATAVADLIDNSLAAGARSIEVDVVHDGAHSYVAISDDGQGMTANALQEAFRFGTRRDYERGQLGRYGLGLKTASLSQARRLTVITRRRSDKNSPVVRRTLDLDTIAEWDRWIITEEEPTEPAARAIARFRAGGHGTTVVWELLDRVIPEQRWETGYAKRRLNNLTEKLKAHIAMVFHRFIEGTAQHCEPVTISVNGEKVQAWNPFAPDEPARVHLPNLRFTLHGPNGTGEVRLARFVLPARDDFSSPAEFDRMSGPLKWNRQQGLYIYRADRLVQWGGWASLRAIDEHTKLARAALDFDTDLDSLFNINVAKMRVTVPGDLRQVLEEPLKELCQDAGETYRDSSGLRTSKVTRVSDSGGDVGAVGVALQVAALELGASEQLRRLFEFLGERDPDLLSALMSAGSRP